MRLVVTAVILVAGMCAFGASPKAVYSWNFEDDGKNGTLRGGERRVGQGADGSTGAWVGKGSTCQATSFPLDFKAFAVDMKFQLDSPVDPKEGNTLLCYVTKPWGKASFRLRLTHDSRLEAIFQKARGEDGSAGFDWVASSEPLVVGKGVFHSVRFSVAADGEASAWFDGVLALKKSGAPGLPGIATDNPPKWYPLLRIGEDIRYPNKPTAYLNGVVDDVAIYGEALGAPEVVFHKADFSGVRRVEYKAGAKTHGVALLLDGSGRGETGHFQVQEREVGALGHWVKAEDKFVRNAATASFKMDEREIEVEFTCPVPEGMVVRKHDSSPFAGDEVEFFIRPDVTRPEYRQYVVNAAGLKKALMQGGGSEKTLAGGFEATVSEDARGFCVRMLIPRKDVFPQMPKPGDVFTVNFIRCGGTAGGISTWANVGQAVHSPDLFGRVVWGGIKAYFGRRLAEAEAMVSALASDEARKAGEKALAPLRDAVSRHGSDNGAYGALEVMFADFSQAMISISRMGERLVAFRPPDPWANRLEISPLTPPLGKIAISAARNSKAWYGFAVANLSDDAYMGQVKVFDKGPKREFSYEGTDGAARHFTIHESLPVDIGGGAFVWDPVAPLPMNSVLRIGARQTALLWLELDATGLKPGRHFAVLCIKRARAAFKTVTIPVEIDISDVDLGSVRCVRAAYEWVNRRCVNKPGVQRMLSRISSGTLYLSMPPKGFWPQYGSDGTLGPSDFTELDAAVSARIAAGEDPAKLRVWIFLALEMVWNAPRAANGSYIPFGTPAYEKGVVEAVRRFERHLLDRYGISSDRILLYTFDEPSASDGVDDPAMKTKMSRAYRIGKVLKSADPGFVTFTNPHAYGTYAERKFGATLDRLVECYDIIEFYRPNLTPAVVAKAKSLPFKELWTYSIWSKTSSPASYRQNVWENMRDGFDMSVYWHVDRMAGGDGFDSTDTMDAANDHRTTDEGSFYFDYDSGNFLPSRRSIAHDIGHEDLKLVRALRTKYANDAGKLAEIERIVKNAANLGTMAAMDAARLELLAIGAGRPHESNGGGR